jgi:hypothetical protein
MCGTGNAGQNSNTGKLKAVSITAKLWEKSEIIVKFMKEGPDEKDYLNGFKNTYADGEFKSMDTNGYEKLYDPFEKQMYNKKGAGIISCIVKIVKERIEPITNLKFSFNSPYFTGDSDIRISFDGSKGCYSKIGNDSKLVSQDLPTMNFGWFDVGTVLHEFGHVLGLGHEHQNPNDNNIDWNVENLNAWAKKTQNWDPIQVDEQIIKPLNITLTNGTSFDPNSIMLYFYPKEVLKKAIRGTRQNIILSPIDVCYINYLYPPDYGLEPYKKLPTEFYEQVYKEVYEENKVDIDNMIQNFNDIFYSSF